MVSKNRPPESTNLDELFNGLTERHIEALQAILLGFHNSKAVARHLNISPGRVDKIFQEINKKLGVRKRGLAVEMFAEWRASQPAEDSQAPFQATRFLVDQSPGLFEADELVFDRPVEYDAGAPDTPGGSFAEPQEPYSTSANGFAPIGLVPLILGRRPDNALSSRKTLIAIAVLAAAALAGVGSAISLLQSLTNLYHL